MRNLILIRPTVGCNKRCFCPSASVAYKANNLRTQRPSVPKFGRKVPHLRCDSHTSFKIKRSKVRVKGRLGHTVSAKPGGHTACFIFCLNYLEEQMLSALMLGETKIYDIKVK